jgi:basic membrane protein A
VPDAASAFLTSVMKNMDVAVYNTVVNVLNLGVVGNAYLGTLSNGGVGLAPYHDNEGLVSAELAAAIEQLKADIIADDESTPGTQGDGLTIFLTPEG